MKRFFKWAGVALLIALIGGLVIGWTPDTDPKVMKAKYANAASQFVNIREGLAVHVRDEGNRDSPAIVLIHGSNDSLQAWDPWTEMLKSKFRVIRLDLPGHGLTGPDPKGDYSNQAFSDVIEAVTHKLGCDRFTLVGHSMGGGVAISYALAHQARVSSLVLIDTAGGPSGSAAKLPIAFRIAQTPVLSTLMNIITPRSFIEKSVHQSVEKQKIVTDQMIDRYWELLRFPGNRKATELRFRAKAKSFRIAELHQLAMPTLILWGLADKGNPVATGHWFETNIPNAKLIAYPGVGHLPMQEASDRSEQDLVRWLETKL
jgi:pimeloyl-ACP methyl ester carboxylesterase